MITITTATGKEFQSDYAIALPNMPVGYIRIIHDNLKYVRSVFSDNAELPLKEYPQYSQIVTMIDETTALKLVLKP